MSPRLSLFLGVVAVCAAACSSSGAGTAAEPDAAPAPPGDAATDLATPPGQDAAGTSDSGPDRGLADVDAGPDAARDATRDALADAAPLPPDTAAPDAAPAPILDPALFDCTSPGASGGPLPERRSPIPVACGLDPTCRTPQIAAHRGAGGQLGALAPEDTLAAYRAAIVLGIEFVETDPRPTADGVLVNMHDDTVNRTTDGTGAVDGMTFEALRALHVKADWLPGDFSCERVPTLVEILQTCRGRVVVLVDANKTDRVDLLVQAIVETDSVDWAVFDTSDVGKIEAALALEPRLHVMPRPDTAEDLEAALDRLAPRIPVIVEVPGNKVAELAPLAAARGSRVLTDAFGADIFAVQMGDPIRYLELYDQGAAILQVERPDLVRQALIDTGRRSP